MESVWPSNVNKASREFRSVGSFGALWYEAGSTGRCGGVESKIYPIPPASSPSLPPVATILGNSGCCAIAKMLSL